MMEKMLSIIVPIYNAEIYLRHNLVSLLKQYSQNKCFEVLLIDDGSTDGSLKICLDLQREYECVKIFEQENLGVSSARNKGIVNAKGKYVCFLDCDDYVEKDYIEKILKNIDGNDLCIFDNFIENENAKYKEKKCLKIFFDKKIDNEIALEWICENKLNAPWDKIYVREIIEKHEVVFLNGLNMGEDLLFNLDYIQHCENIIISSDSIYTHVINGDSLCHRKVSIIQLKEFVIVYNKMKELLGGRENKEKYYNIIKKVFLRYIVNYSGKLYKNGYTVKQIKKIFNKETIVQEILNIKVDNFKDFIRIFILKKNMYRLANIFFNK